MRPTAKERILLHLLDFARFGEELEVPADMAQDGIARATWLELRHLTQYLRPLIREGLVRERTVHVRGARQRRKVYDLTDAGKRAAIRLRDQLKAEVVRVREGDTSRESTVAEILSAAGGKASLLAIARQVAASGAVDLAALAAPAPTAFVARLAEAPRLGTFVGRGRELEAVLTDSAPARVLVVRGVAGIGKSSFAAKASDLLRGRRNLFWHRIRPWDSPASLLAALGDFLAALGKPGLKSVLVRGETSRAAQVLREDLPGANALLVFDDAHEASPEALEALRLLKEALAAAPDVKALVLTRRSLSFYDRRDVAIQRTVAEMELAGLAEEDIAKLLPEGEGARLGALLRGLGGHPLFLELVRAHPTGPTAALQDVHRFIEEEIYRKLTDPERRMMKAACLYDVPVPREALFPDADIGHEVLVSLADRSLIRPMGGDRYGVHETIREFFAGVLTRAEREALRGFAATRLRELGEAARREGDFVTCLNCLENGLALVPPEERAAVLEALGDTTKSIGDFRETLASYARALEGTADPETVVRLHRKTAEALLIWEERAKAEAEIEAALKILGEAVHPERGWLELLRCDLAQAREEWEEAREHGRAALQVFQAVGDATGQANALTVLADIEMYALRGDPRTAEAYLTSALRLAAEVRDAKTFAFLHESMARLCARELGDIDRAMKYLDAVASSSAVMADPMMRTWFLGRRAWYHLDFRADYDAAEADFREAMELGAQLRDAVAVTFNRFGLATAAFFRGLAPDARPEFDACAKEFAAEGFHGYAVEALWRSAECSLWAGDLAGFRTAVAVLEEPSLARGIEARPILVQSLRAADRFSRGDREWALAALDESIRFVEAELASSDRVGSPRAGPRILFPHVPHLYRAVLLRAAGRAKGADVHLTRAEEILRGAGLRARLAVLREQARRFAHTLRSSRQ